MIKPYQFRAFVISAVLMMVCLAVFTSKPINALTPLDEEALIELSPSLMEEIEEKEKSLPPCPRMNLKTPSVLNDAIRKRIFHRPRKPENSGLF